VIYLNSDYSNFSPFLGGSEEHLFTISSTKTRKLLLFGFVVWSIGLVLFRLFFCLFPHHFGLSNTQHLITVRSRETKRISLVL
jgi:hypothetical protein